jgi:hypothetical protein
MLPHKLMLSRGSLHSGLKCLTSTRLVSRIIFSIWEAIHCCSCVSIPGSVICSVERYRLSLSFSIPQCTLSRDILKAEGIQMTDAGAGDVPKSENRRSSTGKRGGSENRIRSGMADDRNPATLCRRPSDIGSAKGYPPLAAWADTERRRNPADGT